MALSTCPLDPALGAGKTRLRWSTGLRALGHHVEMVEPHRYEPWHGRRGRRFRQAWGAVRFVEDHLREREYDLVELYGGEFGLVARRLAKRQERPMLVAHTDGFELMDSERACAYEPGTVRTWYRRQTHDRLSRASFEHTDVFVALSAADTRHAVELGLYSPERAAVVHPGLDDEYLDVPFAAEREHRIAFTGSWIARKGIGSLVAVASRLLGEDERLNLDVHGANADRNAVLSSFPAAVRDRVTVHGRLSNAELAESLRRAKVFFFPTQYEGFGMALAEAMACGCAAMTTPTGLGADLRDGHEARICGFHDTAAMEEGVRQLLSDNVLRAEVARAGWERVQGLRWPAQVRRLAALYERWLDG